eukprot:gene23691-28713_t
MSTVLTELLFGNLLSHVNQTNGLKLHPEHLVSDYFPEFAPGVPPDSRRRHPTVQDLALHTSGLPRYSPCRWGTPDCNITAQEACRRMANWTLLFEPGASVSYSNAGFSLLGAVMEEATNKTYQVYLSLSLPFDPLKDLMKQYISKPLELEHTAVHPPIDTRYQASAYDANGNITGLESFGFDAPSAEILTTQNPTLENYQMYDLVSKTGTTDGYNSLMIFDPDLKTTCKGSGRYRTSGINVRPAAMLKVAAMARREVAMLKVAAMTRREVAMLKLWSNGNDLIQVLRSIFRGDVTTQTLPWGRAKLGMVALMAEDGEPSSATSMPEALINLFALTILPKLYRFLEEIQTTQQQNHKELPYDPTIYIG